MPIRIQKYADATASAPASRGGGFDLDGYAQDKGVWLVLNGLLVNGQPLLVNNTALKVTPDADA